LTLYASADAEIRQGYPTANYGDDAEMWCGYDDSLEPDGRILRCLMKFDLSRLPAGATIRKATLRVYYLRSWDFPGQTRTYTAYRIPADWTESGVTWNNAPTPAEAYGSTGITHGSWGWHSFNITELARAWQRGTYPNYGVMLRGPEGAGSDSSWKGFATRESGVAPELVIDYTPPTLGASPTLLHFRAYSGAPSVASRAVAIRNTTAGSLDWSAAKVGGAAWLTLQDSSGTVTPSAPDTLSVLVDLSGLAYGHYAERISVSKTSEPRDCSTRTIDVVLDYAAGPPPQNVFLPMVHKPGGGGRDAAALIVGVAEYPYFETSGDLRASGDPTQLQFTDDDARDMRDAVINLAAVSDVTTLLNSDAKKGPIKSAIQGLAARAKKRTLVFFSFSGHGGQVPDVPPLDEADGFDEFIAPYDTTLSGQNIILDDELSEWFSDFESEHLVIQIDSCNSGGMFDAAGLAAGRGIPLVLKAQGVPARVGEADGLAADLNAEGRVVLVASRTDQESWEFAYLQNGAFSYYFVESLASEIADGDGDGWVSAEEAFSYAQCRVDNYVHDNTGGVSGGPYHQNPQLYDGTVGEERISQY
jgi:uncharacterized caspase-like protein